MDTGEMFQTGNCTKALGWAERGLGVSGMSKGEEDKVKVGKVCRADHERAGRSPRHHFGEQGNDTI